METSTTRTPTTMRNWNVDDVLGSLLLERGKRLESRHFHQLFHNLRVTQIAVDNARLDAVIGDLGHVDDLLHGHLRKCTSCSPSCGTGASRICTKRQMTSSCSTVCCSTRSCGRGSKTGPGSNPAVSSSNNSDVRGPCTGGPLSQWGFVQVAPLTSLCAMVSGHRQCHCDGLLLMTPLSTPRGAPSVASSHP